MKTRLEIASGEKVEQNGDLTIEHDICEGAELKITDGSLIVKGNIRSGAKIQLIDSDCKNNLMKGISISGGSISISGGSYSSIRYINGQLYINGKKVNPSESVESKSEPKNLKLIVHGTIHDNVTLNSDAEIRVEKSIGSHCEIKSEHAGLTAGNIGRETNITVHGDLSLHNAGAGCHLTSSMGRLTAQVIENNAVVKARNSIEVKGFGDNTVITSEYGDLSSPIIGKNSRIKVRNALRLVSVGASSHLTSEYGDIKATQVSESVVIQVRNNAEIFEMKDRGSVKSEYGSITITGEAGNNLNLNARNDIVIKKIGNNGTLKSEYGSITVTGEAGNSLNLNARNDIVMKKIGNNGTLHSDYGSVRVAGPSGDFLNIQARNNVDINQVGSRAQITSDYGNVTTGNLGSSPVINARNDITVNGTSPRDAVLESSYGRVRKNGPIQDFNLFASRPEESKVAVEEVPAEYICPITKKMMMSPTLCLLDGQTYEEHAIKARILEMKLDKPIDQVLCRNRVMESLISKYIETNPQVLKMGM